MMRVVDKYLLLVVILVHCSKRVNAAVVKSQTAIKVGDIQAMLLHEINSRLLEDVGGPDDRHTITFLTPTEPLNTVDFNEEMNSNSTENTTSSVTTPAPSRLSGIEEAISDYFATLAVGSINDEDQRGAYDFNSILHYPGRVLRPDRSVSGVYSRAIQLLEVDPPRLSSVEQRRYDEATQLMNEQVPGSVIGRTTGEDVTKLDVYRHFRALYFTAREEKETELERQKNTLDSTDYRRWYMYNYRKLKDNEKSALQDWVIRGYKKIIGEALETVDLETPNVELEDAKNALEAAVTTDTHGKISYHAELSPSNWQEHLFDKIHDPTPTSSQLLNMILHLKEYSIIVQAIGKAHESEATDAQTEVNTEQADVTAQETALINQAVSLIKQLDACNQASADCPGIDDLAEAQRNDTNKWKDDQEDLDENKLILANANSIKTAVDNTLKKIGDKITEYEVKYETAKLEEMAEENGLLVTHNYPEDDWKSFHFNSEIVFEENDEQIGRFDSFQPENVDEEFVKILEKRGSKTLELEVDMHYMGVNVYRPWFHGNIFQNPAIKPENDILISPGFVDDLHNVLKKKLSDGTPLYKFPLYPTSLVIAKDIKMKIRGLNEDAGRMLIENSYNPDQLGIEPPEIVPDEDGSPYHHIGSIFGFGYTNVDSHAIRFRVRQDFNDVDIELLEPHLIGQFCDIIRKLP